VPVVVREKSYRYRFSFKSALYSDGPRRTQSSGTRCAENPSHCNVVTEQYRCQLQATTVTPSAAESYDSSLPKQIVFDPCRFPVPGNKIPISHNHCGVELGRFSWLITAVAYLVAGLSVEGRLRRSTIVAAKEMLLPVFATTLLLFCTSFILAYVLVRQTGLDAVSAFPAATPGILESVGTVAAELQGDSASEAPVFAHDRLV
jgi:hypothetical protein